MPHAWQLLSNTAYGHITREQHELGPTYGSSTTDIIGGVLHAAGQIDNDIPFKDNSQVRAVVLSKTAHFETAAAAGFEAMPGAIAFVQLIATHYKGRTALVTSSAKRFVLPFSARYGLGQYFPADCIVSEDTVVASGLQGKPEPDPYVIAMKRLGITDAARPLVFEDTVPGVISAKKAGATVVALGFDKQSAKLFASGDLPYSPDVFVVDYDEAARVLGLVAQQTT